MLGSDIGYVQSKWVAEKLVTTARERGFQSLFTLGRMSGHSKTGVSNTDDFMHRVLRGCIQLKSAPDANMMVDMTPVDYVSRAIIHLSKQKNLWEKLMCSIPPIHWRELVTWLRSFGYPYKADFDQEWQSGLMSSGKQNCSMSMGSALKMHCIRLCFFFSESVSEPSNSAMRQFDCQNTLDGLADTYHLSTSR